MVYQDRTVCNPNTGQCTSTMYGSACSGTSCTSAGASYCYFWTAYNENRCYTCIIDSHCSHISDKKYCNQTAVSVVLAVRIAQQWQSLAVTYLALNVPIVCQIQIALTTFLTLPVIHQLHIIGHLTHAYSASLIVIVKLNIPQAFAIQIILALVYSLVPRTVVMT